VLEITKTDNPDPVTAGGVDFTYTITVKNTGPSDAKLVSVLDDLPAGFVTTGFSGPGTLPVVGADPFTWGVGTLVAGATAVLVVTYRVESGVLPGTYRNTATVSSPTDAGGPREAFCDTTVVSSAVLTITKGPALQGTNAGDGITYSYTITVTNTGVSNARNVTVVDTWPKPAGSLVQGTITVTAGSTPIPEPDGDFTWIIDSLPSGPATLTVTYTVPVTTVVGDYVNNVSMTSDGFPTPLTAFATTVVAPPTPTADTPALIIGTDDGCNILGIVRVIDPVLGGELASFEPYLGYKGSVRVASGDVNGDGVSDIVVAPGRGRAGLVRVFTAAGTPLDGGAFDFYPFGTSWRGGVEVAVGNVDGLPGNEIIAATSTGKPLVNVFQVNGSVNPTPIRSFRPFPKPYAAGVMLTVGDYGTYTNGSWSNLPDGRAEIAVGTNAGVPAQVRIFNAAPTTPVLLRSFLPFGSKFRRGVTLSSARFSSAVIEDLFVGTGVGGKSQLKIFDGSGAPAGGSDAFTTFFSKPNALLFTAALDLTGGNGKVDSIYGAQGRGGVNGLPSGLGRLTATPPVTALGSWKAPLRIAPILIGPPAP
jgi:uncharacterized repeat protein (TIGR01451 family)